MDPITQQTVLAAAGAAGGEKVYVDDVFSTYLYEGTGLSKQITNGLDLAGEKGLVWFKAREPLSSPYTNLEFHCLFDNVRTGASAGSAGGGGRLRSDSSQGSQSDTYLDSYNSNGFTITSNSTDDAANLINQSGKKFVSWSFRKAPGFFDVVTWTGDGIAGKTIAHSLGSVPGMIIIKNLDSSYDWSVYHRSLANTHYMRLNSTATAESTNNYWNSTTATSTHFTLGDHGSVNKDNDDFVAYVFAHDEPVFGTDEDESIIKCGSYTGNGGTKAIDVGFEPQWFFIKNSTTSSTSWQTFDIMRGAASNGLDQPRLEFDSAGQETSAYRIHVTSTGFTIDSQSSDVVNSSGDTYIYMAIRRPNKPPEAATEVFAIDTRGGTSPTPPTYNSGFPLDWIWTRDTTASNWQARARLTGKSKYLQLNSTNATGDNALTRVTFDRMDGAGTDTGVDSANYAWMFKRAPGFMDNVVYKGDAASNRAVDHNLGVTPELLIVKRFDNIDPWRVQYTGIFGAGTALRLDDAGAVAAGSAFNGASAPTASNFYVGSDSEANGSGERYVAYLFATLPGISKVGSYTGTGSDINVDCGFTNGARFVLIKRTDSTADWFLYDTTRGISSGNDPYLKVNHAESQVTNTDYIDPLSSGFIANSNSADINASGGTYLFLAIA